MNSEKTAKLPSLPLPSFPGMPLLGPTQLGAGLPVPPPPLPAGLPMLSGYLSAQLLVEKQQQYLAAAAAAASGSHQHNHLNHVSTQPGKCSVFITIIYRKRFHTYNFSGELAIFILASWVSFHCNIYGNEVKTAISKISYLKIVKMAKTALIASYCVRVTYAIFHIYAIYNK